MFRLKILSANVTGIEFLKINLSSYLISDPANTLTKLSLLSVFEKPIIVSVLFVDSLYSILSDKSSVNSALISFSSSSVGSSLN